MILSHQFFPSYSSYSSILSAFHLPITEPILEHSLPFLGVSPATPRPGDRSVRPLYAAPSSAAHSPTCPCTNSHSWRHIKPVLHKESPNLSQTLAACFETSSVTLGISLERAALTVMATKWSSKERAGSRTFLGYLIRSPLPFSIHVQVEGIRPFPPLRYMASTVQGPPPPPNC